MVQTEELVDRWCGAFGQRAAWESAARGEVVAWRWFAGNGNPLDPAPLDAVVRGIKPARPADGPGKGVRLEVGLGEDGRARLCVRHTGWGPTYCTVWRYEAEGALSMEWQDGAAPWSAGWLAFEGGRVVRREVVGSSATWSAGPPTAAERAALLTPPFGTHSVDHYAWEGERVVRVRTESFVPRFEIVTELDHGARGAVTAYRIIDGVRRKLTPK